VLTPIWTIGSWSGAQGVFVDSFGSQWMVEKDTGWFEPPGVRLDHADRQQDHGVYRTRNYRAARDITLTGVCISPDISTMMGALDRFATICSDGGMTAMTVTEPGGNVRTAQVELADMPRATPFSSPAYAFDFQLMLIAQDPRKYDATVQITTTGLPSSSGGLNWSGGLSWSSGLNWGTVTSTGVLVVTNSGTAETWPTFQISAGANALTNPGITLTVAGNRLFYNNTLQVGDVLTIVTNPIGRAVTLNGTTDRRPFLTVAEWTSVAPGATVPIAFSAASYTSTAQLSASWQNAYW
jgi:hypothetical protein